MSKQVQRLYEFGPFRLDTSERLLLRDGAPVPLTPKAFQVLCLLVERSGRLVEKEELIKSVWSDAFVEESNVTNQVYALRKALGDGGNGKGYIETVPKQGYRFTAPVLDLTDAGGELMLEKHSITRIITEEIEEQETQLEPKSAPLLLADRSNKHSWRRWQVGVAALLLLSLLAGGLLLAIYRPWLARDESGKSGAAVTPAPLRSIAVLPFKSIGAESDNEYLGLGLADALITRLGNIREIVVRPTSAVRRYVDTNQDPVAAGRQQGVDAVLDGSFQRTGERLRITVQLIRVSDAATLWSAQFDEQFTDIFSVQDSISERVACDLVTHICGDEKGRLLKQREIPIDAYEAYLKGRYFWNKRTVEGYQKAAGYFNQAIELDPAYPQAYVGLADVIVFTGGDKESMAKGRAALKKAIEIDDSLAEPHATLGLLAMNVDWDWAEAEREYKRSIELNPNYPTAHHWYAEFLAYMGRFNEALAEIKRAHELDPLSLIIATDVGKVYDMARRYDEAIEQYKRVLEIDPQFPEAHGLLALTYSMKGQHEEAIAELLKIKELESNQIYLSWLVYVYGVSGRRDQAQGALNQLKDLSKHTYVSPFWMAAAYTGLGEKDEAFKWFDKVFEERAPAGVVTLKVNPIWDSLRSDPRFTELLRRAGFQP